MFEAFLADVEAVGVENLSNLTRLGVRLTEQDREELHRRLHELFDEFARRERDSGGEPWGLFFAAHPDPRPVETTVPGRHRHDTIGGDHPSPISEDTIGGR
jgi:hypothetical protein